MSTLDQAFIRAYRAGATKPAAATNAAAVATPANPAPRYFVDESHDGAALPHYFDAHAKAAPTAQAAASSVERLQASLMQANRAAAGLAAAPAMPTPIMPPTAKPVAKDEFHAAYETAGFVWPRTVEVLIAAAGNEFAQFTQELIARIGAGRKTLVVTGADRGEGRSTLVLALARLAANRQLRTVLVDLDLRSPNLADQLGLRPELGWEDAQAERLPTTDVLIESLAEHVALMPMRNAMANPRVLAGSTFLKSTIDELKSHYDLVLLDVGPLVDDGYVIDLGAALSGAMLDDGLIVRDRRRTTPKQVQEVCRRLAVLGVRHWDVAENFTEIQGY